MMVHDRGSSQLGEVSGGRLRFSKAPHTCQDRFMHLNIRDRSGGLWVPGSVRGSGGTCDWISGQLALRITGEGAVGQWKNAGWATLADQGGNVWLGSIRGQEQDVFNIWREGRTVHTVAVPGAFERCALVSDKPGSVFVWTRLGLRHVVADDPARPGAYALGKLYTVPAFEGAEQVAGFSRLGLLAVTTCRDRPGSRKYYLYLIRLPGSGAAPSPFAPRK